jgi:hypothetical protein
MAILCLFQSRYGSYETYGNYDASNGSNDLMVSMDVQGIMGGGLICNVM